MDNEVYFNACAEKAQKDFENENKLLKPLTKYIVFDIWLNLDFKTKLICFLKYVLKLITRKYQAW
jgi:hypothetical protein